MAAFHIHENRHRGHDGPWGWITRTPDWRSAAVGYWSGSEPRPGTVPDLRAVERDHSSAWNRSAASKPDMKWCLVNAADQRVIPSIPDEATARELLAWLCPNPAEAKE